MSTTGADLESFVDRGDLLVALKDLTGRQDVVLIEDGIEVSRATKGIEGFLSLVLRVKTPYRCGDCSDVHVAWIIVKCMPRIGLQRDMVKSTRVFPREGTFFEKVFPLLRRAAGDNVPLPMPMAHLSIYGSDEDAIFMEDLGVLGFRTPAVSYRVKGLDMEHIHLAMDAYGRLHALTIAAEKFLPKETATWAEAFPELAKNAMLKSPRPNSPIPFIGIVEKSVETIMEISEGLEGLPKEVATSGRLKPVLDDIFNLMRKIIKTGEPKVLTHGDCWMNNSMFRYEMVGREEKPVDIRLLDFQMSCYCHPCIDLAYFFFISVRKTFREIHMEGLIRLYHDSLTRSLKAMNVSSPPFTVEKLWSDFQQRYKSFGLMFESLFLPMFILGEEFTPSNAEDLTPEKYNNFVETGNSSTVRSQYANDPCFRSILDEIIRDLIDNIFPDGADGPVSPLFLCDGVK